MAAADNQLLFGILALQNGLIDQFQLSSSRTLRDRLLLSAADFYGKLGAAPGPRERLPPRVGELAAANLNWPG